MCQSPSTAFRLIFCLLTVLVIAGCSRKMQSGISWGGSNTPWPVNLTKDSVQKDTEKQSYLIPDALPSVKFEKEDLSIQPGIRRLLYKAALKYSLKSHGDEVKNHSPRFTGKIKSQFDEPESPEATKASGDNSWLAILFACIMLFLLWFVLKAVGLIDFSFWHLLGSLALMILFIIICSG